MTARTFECRAQRNHFVLKWGEEEGALLSLHDAVNKVHDS
jgi:hypothetical protein